MSKLWPAAVAALVLTTALEAQRGPPEIRYERAQKLLLKPGS